VQTGGSGVDGRGIQGCAGRVNEGVGVGGGGGGGGGGRKSGVQKRETNDGCCVVM